MASTRCTAEIEIRNGRVSANYMTFNLHLSIICEFIFINGDTCHKKDIDSTKYDIFAILLCLTDKLGLREDFSLSSDQAKSNGSLYCQHSKTIILNRLVLTE